MTQQNKYDVWFNENLTKSINQNTQKRGRKRYKMEKPKAKQKEGTTKEGKLQGKHEQIKYSNILPPTPPPHKEHIK